MQPHSLKTGLPVAAFLKVRTKFDLNPVIETHLGTASVNAKARCGILNIAILKKDKDSVIAYRSILTKEASTGADNKIVNKIFSWFSTLI